MFESALLESAGKLHTQQRWTTAASLMLQAMGMTLVIVTSMVVTDTLPLSAVRTFIQPLAPPTSGPPPSERPALPRRESAAPTNDTVFRAPGRIPEHAAQIVDAPAPPVIGDGKPYIPGALPETGNGRINQVLQSISPHVTAVAPDPPRTIVVSRLDPGMLVARVEPRYPHAAILARVSGAVVMRATIGADGSIERLAVVTGNPLLVGAAMDAVRQWRYRPYVLNGHPVEVETEVTVNFILQR